MNPRLFLFRHGKVKTETREFDVLTPEGEHFRDWLPSYFEQRGIKLTNAYSEWTEGVERCRETISKLRCSHVDFGNRPAKFKTLNAAIAEIRTGNHAVCCRSEAIESGQLYHVIGFDLHTPFSAGDHGQKAREKMTGSYHKIYVCEWMNDAWHQIGVAEE